MNLLLIKIGKALKTIQRDGLFKGGKRVLAAFFALFRLVGSGDILFITGGVGDSARYRTAHISEELESQGFSCSITVQDNPMLASYAKKFKVFVFHRVLFTPSVEKMIGEIKKQKKEIIFETDDLVYDPKYLEFMDYFKQMNSFEKKLYENGVGGEILADPYVKVCTTTTGYLAEKLREHGKKVFVIKNKLSRKDVEIADAVISHQSSVISEIQNSKFKIQNSIRIGYFSGALSHNKDFATITNVLYDLMKKYEKLELFLVGPLDIESKLNEFSTRIKQLPYVKREKHFENVASVDINIAPLEIGNPFCESKSELKFFEAGIVQVPSVAAATEPFREAIIDGVDGFVAKGEDEWREKLEKLITDENLRKEMGEKARMKALKEYTTENAKDEEYWEYLKTKIG
jgi:glycosyltransferase involved in cell wall biosynthesis